MANQFIYSPLLTDFGVKAGVGEFGAALGIAPLARSRSITNSYLNRERQKLGQIDTKRAPGEDYKKKQPSKGSLSTFTISDHGLIIPVPQELVDGYNETDLFAEKANASMEALIEVRNAHAVAVKDAVWATSQAAFNTKYGTANVVVPSTKWDASGSTIESDVANAKERVRIQSGYPANVVAMTQTVFNAIVDNPNSSVYDRLKYTNDTATTKQKLASLLRVDEVIVFGELANTANPGQTDSFGDLFTGDNVLVFYRNTAPVMDKMTLAQTFFWETARSPFLGIMERFNDNNNSYEYKASGYFHVELTSKLAGNVLWDVLT